MYILNLSMYIPYKYIQNRRCSDTRGLLSEKESDGVKSSSCSGTASGGVGDQGEE